MTGPEWIPCGIFISDASWDTWRGELEDVCARHPLIFPGFEKGKRNYDAYDFGPAQRANERFTDAWGCVWYDAIDGLEGQVIEHPLSDWAKLKTYKPPDPLVRADRGPANWDDARKHVEEERRKGRITTGSLAHGWLYMRLMYLRGFENLMIDFATDPPELQHLIDMIVEHSQIIISEWLRMNIDVMGFPEDLGTQKSAVISPKTFRKWIAPAYNKLMEPCRRAGSLVDMHSDGYIMELMDQLIECGVSIINPQDLLNGIDNLAKHIKGRVCIRLDIDRQKIVPFGTRKDIRALVEEEVRKLGSPEGGLMLIAGIYPPTSPENVDALACAMEEFRTYWWDRPAKSS